MAKVTITFEDKGNGNVSIVSDPTFETMMMMGQSGHQWTAAQGYALNALNSVKKASKQQGALSVDVPKLGSLGKKIII